MKKIITAICILIGYCASGQYSPSNFTVSNKSYGVAQAVSTDARSWFYDAGNFVMRDYQDTTEVNNYLNLGKYRAGHFPIFVHFGGTLNGNGTYAGGTTRVWWYRDSTARNSLVRWYTDSVPTTGFLLAANNLSDLQSISTAKVNLSLNLVDNTSDATKNSASVTLTNHTISGSANTLTNIGNGSLTNSTIGLTLTATGTDVTIPVTPASLGGNITINIPSASASARGALTAANWSSFRAKVDSTTASNDSVFDWHNGSATFRYLLEFGAAFIGMGLSNSHDTVSLGQNIGAPGAPATLLRSREIPMNGFNIDLSGSTGNFIIGSLIDNGPRLQVNGVSAIYGTTSGTQQIIRLPVSQSYSNPYFQVQNSSGVSIYESRIVDSTNIYLGVNVGASTTTGTGNIAIGGVEFGVTTFGHVTTGHGNIALGARALAALTTGLENTAIADAALTSNVSGNHNTAIGQAALAFNTANSDNVAIGENAGHGTAANFDRTVLIGSFSFNNATAGSDNVVVGDRGISATASSQGNQNIAIGSSVGLASTFGSGNIVLGYMAHSGNNIGNNNITLGSNISFGSALSNTTLLGTSMSSSVANIAGIGRSDQNVILGITTITADNGARLQVSGNQSVGVVVSSAGTLALDATGGAYVFGGTTTTWTLPAISGHTGWTYFIKNKGSGNITLNSNAGGNDIYNTSAVNTLSITPGQAFILVNDGTTWDVK